MTSTMTASKLRKQTPRARAASRRNERGAALVEAAVVIPVMLVFLGLIMFTHRSYEVKLDKQLGTRAGVLYYASHACEGDVPRDVVPTTQEANPGIDPGPQDRNAGKIGGSNSPGAQAGIQRSNNLVKALPADTVVNGRAVQDRRTVSLTRNVSAGSEVACNEKTYPNKWLAVFQEIGSLWESKGGLVD